MLNYNYKILLMNFNMKAIASYYSHSHYLSLCYAKLVEKRTNMKMFLLFVATIKSLIQ